MLVLVVGRFVQGIGGGGLYTVSLGAVAKTYPERIRPRVMALLASMWIVPGLLGPPVGTLIATTLGWRWAFLIPIPLIVVGVLLVIPSLRSIGSTPDTERLPVAASLLLMLGAGVFLAGLTSLNMLERGTDPGRARRRDPGAAPDHAARHLHGSSRPAGGRGGRVPRLVRVPRGRRLPDVDAHEGARALGRPGRARDHGRDGGLGRRQLVRVAHRRSPRGAVDHDARRGRDRRRDAARGDGADPRRSDRRRRTSDGASAGSGWAWCSRRSRSP